MDFSSFHFHEALAESLEASGYQKPTPIQEKAIPIILEGKDIIASAQTGTGKTAAFLLPILHKLLSEEKNDTDVHALILVPTRELAIQISSHLDGLTYFTSLSSIAVYGGGDGGSFVQEKQALSKGVDIAFSRGMICVVSAGNDGNNSWHYVASPADANHALTIGAVNALGNYASFSSQGPSFDGRVKPDVVAKGANPYVAIPSGSITNAYSGTSFSGPIIAGMVASFWQALPLKTNAELVQLIKESASIYATPNVTLGYGIPNFSLALANALSVQEYSENQFLLFPNPFEDSVSISFPRTAENPNLTIFSIVGQKVFEKKLSNNETTLPLNRLLSGVYFYQIQSKNNIQTGKLIKQ